MTLEGEKVISFEIAKRERLLRSAGLDTEIKPGDTVELVTAPKWLLEAALRYYNRKRDTTSNRPKNK